MADAMVTARMPPEKKDAGNRALEQLGTNASQAVNRLYDFVIEKGRLPFPDLRERSEHSREEIAEAMAWAESIKMRGTPGRLDKMTLKEAKGERLAARGLVDRGSRR